MTSCSIGTIQLHGLLGAALDANLRGRLSHFIVDEHSPAIGIFAADAVQQNQEGDWYGEHAGKWLYAAAKAAVRCDDATLVANIRRVTRFLIARQEPDGYLGTYAPERRFMLKQAPKPRSWNGEPTQRTWDIWIHAYLVLGLLEVYKQLGDSACLDAARKIGDLCWRTLRGHEIDITDLGNHHGMSATVLLDAAVDLYFATAEQRYLDLAELVLEQANEHQELGLLTRALSAADASEIATGKAYQLIWNLVGIAKLHRATGKPAYLHAVEHLWTNIQTQHLSLGGGPWGGVAHRSREVFNAAGAFVPQGYVETCSILAWIQLNRELLQITGEARYAEEIERSAYNDLLGAMAPDGENWCYYSFANGRRVHTTYWRCCKSSGAMAIEELPALAYSAADNLINVNLYGASSAQLEIANVGTVNLHQTSDYPFAGTIQIRVSTERPGRFTLRLRIPSWAAGAALAVNGAAVSFALIAGEYAALDREWRSGDKITLELPMQPALQRRSQRNVQESRAPDGAPIRQEVLHFDYAAITRGPLVYSTGLIDGFKTDETLRLPTRPPSEWLEVVASSAPSEGPIILLKPGYRPPLKFSPYYCTGGRRDGAWRLTWMSLAPSS